MNDCAIEPRTAMWAKAEVRLEDSTGKPTVVPATLEDTSPSGACIRLNTPINVGARLTVKWHREQFSAVAKNCRSDGREFLLGVRREAEKCRIQSPAVAPKVEADRQKLESKEPPASVAAASARPVSLPASSARVWQAPTKLPEEKVVVPAKAAAVAVDVSRSNSVRPEAPQLRPSHTAGTPPRPERKVMQPKTLFPKFWRRQQDGSDAARSSIQTEAPVNKPNIQAAEGLSGPQGNLLSYEDIYHAAGILNPRSGYNVSKVVDMLNSDRIRDLSNDIKRASVLMALDAAGTAVDDLLQDATRRQQALNSYEESQRKQLEEFEARKARENAEIQAEMERLRAHYAERIQQNQDQVAREKEALRNWQMVMQHESQRISEVIELCSKQPALPPNAAAQGAAAGADLGTGRRDALKSGMLTQAAGGKTN